MRQQKIADRQLALAETGGAGRARNAQAAAGLGPHADIGADVITNVQRRMKLAVIRALQPVLVIDQLLQHHHAVARQIEEGVNRGQVGRENRRPLGLGLAGKHHLQGLLGIGHAQDQGDVVGVEQFAHALEHTRPRNRLLGAGIDQTDELVDLDETEPRAFEQEIAPTRLGDPGSRPHSSPGSRDHRRSLHTRRRSHPHSRETPASA